MPNHALDPTQLRITINPDLLGFSDTSELLQHPLSWIGQERAEAAARFGLSMMQPDYHLFVLGEAGSGRTTLLYQAMVAAATERQSAPDLCYLYNFIAPEKPLALHLPSGQGRVLRQSLLQLTKSLPSDITQCLNGQDFKLHSDHIEKKFKIVTDQAYSKLDKFAESLNFTIHRDDEQIVFTLLDEKGEILTAENLLKLPKERRIEIEQAEQSLREMIAQYFEEFKGMKKERDIALMALQRHLVQPLLKLALKKVQQGLLQQLRHNNRLKDFFAQIESDILDNLTLFETDNIEEEKRQIELNRIFSHYQVNLVVDNADVQGAPVLIEDNPSAYALFGSIDYQFENGKLKTDFMRIRAGSLLEAHGGFLMLHLDDLLTDDLLWIKLRRFLRSKQLQIEEPGSALTSNASVSLEPETVEVNVKIILIGSRNEYYDLQEIDPEFMRRFRVKVDFAASFIASTKTYQASAVLVANVCAAAQLPHFSAAAVARLLEESHREVEDQKRQSAIFARTEMLLLESATFCNKRQGRVVEVMDVSAALQARMLRHNYPDLRLQETILEGEIGIVVRGAEVGQLNALTQIDLGDHSFGTPVRITARSFAGEEGVLNIAREVDMSGPIHDKGMLILQSYLTGLFAHIAPLALSASIVFEQEYTCIEGDSASCAEFYVLLSSLGEVPLKQSIAVTGALNQYGEVLPVGGINDKIEGYFRLCEKMGLTGEQGVLIPFQNRPHLMLNQSVIEAVEQGLFAIYTMQHVAEGLELLTGMPTGLSAEGRVNGYSSDTVLGFAQKTLLTFRRACQLLQHPRNEHRRLPTRSGK
ncbi:ATP-binding protein [Nitrosomonas supralitoralis]|uniref:endopeptidase La n=1 Tax=Nitrosomonas supralitoralis TaxID=2116706 RepID=A0A2P7NW12_9PROT|nr:ATP-binding protein [Nitrosomonas supralitoralis]PSJ17615.1 ATP-dependent protease [Nitrosomonas supralitoralis]